MNNPELKKNVWMEISTNRLILMPVILGVLFLVIYLVNQNDHRPLEAMEAVSITALVCFGVIVYLWGSRMASEAVIAEVNDRTWINQRMTSVSPWQMAIGKLFGSTIYAWYGGLWCILMYVIASSPLPLFGHRLKVMLAFILIGVVTHAVTITLSLLGIDKNRLNQKVQSAFYLIIGVIIAGFLFSNVATIFDYLDSCLSAYYREDMETCIERMNRSRFFVEWFFMKIHISNWMLIHLALLTFWSIVGLYRNMKKELQYENGSGVWVIFLLVMMTYSAGFMSFDTQDHYSNYLMVGLGFASAFALVCTYYLAFSETKYIVHMNLWRQHLAKRNWHYLNLNTPLWMISLLFTTLGILAMFLVNVVFHEDLSSKPEEILVYLPLNVLLFVVRDIAIIMFLNLSPNAKRPDTTAFLYLLILYALLPGLMAAADVDDQYLMAFYPLADHMDEQFLTGLISPLLQCIVAVSLMVMRWNQVKSLDASAEIVEPEHQAVS